MLLFAAAVAAAVWLVPLPARLLTEPSTTVLWDDGSVMHVFLSPDDKYRIEVRPDEVDPDYVTALIRFEDKRFFDHGGVDGIALARSVWLNLSHGEVVSGASTLTMQLARLLEPRPRTLWSKGIEALRAGQLELRLSKDEILTAYMQLIPFGGNVEGVEAAAWSYFGHSAKELSPDEIATLLAVPQNPAARHPTRHNEARLRAARDDIAAWLVSQDALPRGEGSDRLSGEQLLAQVKASKVVLVPRAFPREALHAARWMYDRHDGGDRIRTTLRQAVQALAQRTLGGYRRELVHKGIHNGSVVVIDHTSGEVVAMVGNFDFWDEAHGGQIPGFDQPRSPGSALKPIIYALAIERGIALPGHLVADVPVDYSGYAPDNYDGKFEGLVSLEEALSRSLNVPFVNLLRQVGVERFIATLRSMGLESLDDRPGYYGLSAAIGAMEVTPLELASVYTMFANEGRHRLVRFTPSEEEEPVTPIVSPGSAWLTRRALSRRDRPDFPARRRFTGVPPQIHWKTGTSYGHRDAWAVGSGPRYTAVVWLGNFDNQPSVDLVGAQAAGPVLFDLLEALADRAQGPALAAAPPDLKSIEVCAYSGRLPTAACEHRRGALALREHVPTSGCPYHVLVDIDVETGHALTPGCRSGRRHRTETFVRWPARISRWLGGQHRWLPTPPSLLAGCEPPVATRPPRILSPPPGKVAMLVPGLAADRQEIPLEADSPTAHARLAWFVNGEYVGSARARERVWWTPSRGVHELLVMNENGQSATRTLEVRGVE